MGHNLRYVPEYTTKQENIFVEEYFTGTDTKIFIDEKEATFIAAISYAVSESVLPLYGYNSYTFDDIAVGNRLVSGSILIPITNYDTKITDFTVEENTIIQEENAFLSDGVWKERPYWARIPTEEVEKEDTKSSSDKRLIVREVSRSITIEKPSEGGPGPFDPPEIKLPPSKDPLYKKPMYKRGTRPYFNETYSNSKYTIRFAKAQLLDNYKDIIISLNGKFSKKIISVVFKSSTIQYSANDEPLYESLEFVARDVIRLDGEKKEHEFNGNFLEDIPWGEDRWNKENEDEEVKE